MGRLHELVREYMRTHMCVQSLWRPEEGIRPLGAGVIDGCKQPRGCWESNRPGSFARAVSVLNNQPVLQYRFCLLFDIGSLAQASLKLLRYLRIILVFSIFRVLKFWACLLTPHLLSVRDGNQSFMHTRQVFLLTEPNPQPCNQR